MAEENQVTKEPQQAQRVTTKNLKKTEAGKRLAVHNHRRREEQRKEQAKLEKTTSRVNQYYGSGAVIALGVIDGLGYYIIEPRKESKLGIVQRPRAHRTHQTQNKIILNHTLRHNCSLTSFRWIKFLLYYKNGQEEYSK